MILRLEQRDEHQADRAGAQYACGIAHMHVQLFQRAAAARERLGHAHQLRLGFRRYLIAVLLGQYDVIGQAAIREHAA